MKKTICFIMCAALLCSAFVGCGNERESVSTDNEIKINDLKITADAHYSDMDESVMRIYEKLCTAVMNYEAEFKFNTAMTDDVNLLFYTSCPLYTLVEGMEYLDDNSGVSISYKYDEEEHTKKIDEFKEAVNEIMTECGYGSVGSNQYLLNLYTYISKTVTIDNSVTTVLDTVINKKGISASVSGMFEYLLLQADISASHIINNDSDSIARMLSMAEFNGCTYYFDPASEISETSGLGLMYFAMDSERAAASGSGSFMFTDNTEPEDVSDDTYSKLEKCTSYTVEGSEVTASCKGSDDFIFTLN